MYIFTKKGGKRYIIKTSEGGSNICMHANIQTSGLVFFLLTLLYYSLSQLARVVAQGYSQAIYRQLMALFCGYHHRCVRQSFSLCISCRQAPFAVDLVLYYWKTNKNKYTKKQHQQKQSAFFHENYTVAFLFFSPTGLTEARSSSAYGSETISGPTDLLGAPQQTSCVDGPRNLLREYCDKH